MKTVLRLVTAAAALTVLGAVPGRADSPMEAHALIGAELTSGRVTLEQGWANGVLRVQISGPGDRKSWGLHLDFGPRGVLDLTPADLASRMVANIPRGLIVDLPIPGDGPLSVSSTPGGLRVETIDVIALSTIRPQQMIDGSVPRAIDARSSANEKTTALGFGRLEVMEANGTLIGVCTAFRIRTGYWLTAAHCVYRDEGDPTGAVMGRWRLQPDAYVGQVEGKVLYDATPIAAGLAADKPTRETLVTGRDRDYVLMQVPKDPGGPTFDLGSALPPKVGERLELLQHWKGELGLSPGKVVSDGDSCVVIQRQTADDWSYPGDCPYAIQHGCSSEGGGSGSALVDATTFRLVGLHYGAGQGAFNCATPVTAITADLCKRNPKIAGKVIKCP